MKTYKDLNELMNDRGVKTLITKRANLLASHYQYIIKDYFNEGVEERFDNTETWLPFSFSQAEKQVMGYQGFFGVSGRTIDEIISSKVDWSSVECGIKVEKCGSQAVKDAIIEKARAILENEIEEEMKEKIIMCYASCELEGVNTK